MEEMSPISSGLSINKHPSSIQWHPIENSLPEGKVHSVLDCGGIDQDITSDTKKTSCFVSG